MESSAVMPLPRYKSHKEVGALKIAGIETRSDGSCVIAFENKNYAPVVIGDYQSKFKGNEDDLGYYVLYEDGYNSWSPTEAFEGGYTKIS